MDELIPQYVCESNLIKETNSNQPSARKKEEVCTPSVTPLSVLQEVVLTSLVCLLSLSHIV